MPIMSLLGLPLKLVGGILGGVGKVAGGLGGGIGKIGGMIGGDKQAAPAGGNAGSGNGLGGMLKGLMGGGASGGGSGGGQGVTIVEPSSDVANRAIEAAKQQQAPLDLSSKFKSVYGDRPTWTEGITSLLTGGIAGRNPIAYDRARNGFVGQQMRNDAMAQQNESALVRNLLQQILKNQGAVAVQKERGDSNEQVAVTRGNSYVKGKEIGAEAVKHNADQRLEGVKHTANTNLEGTKFKAGLDYFGDQDELRNKFQIAEADRVAKQKSDAEKIVAEMALLKTKLEGELAQLNAQRTNQTVLQQMKDAAKAAGQDKQIAADAQQGDLNRATSVKVAGIKEGMPAETPKPKGIPVSTLASLLDGSFVPVPVPSVPQQGTNRPMIVPQQTTNGPVSTNQLPGIPLETLQQIFGQ